MPIVSSKHFLNMLWYIAPKSYITFAWYYGKSGSSLEHRIAMTIYSTGNILYSVNYDTTLLMGATHYWHMEINR